MPINNSYSQTPKRIFTNKPFIKGMNYTNADLEPFVCRAISNLELESSNSATKLRPGTSNIAIGNPGEMAYKFYDKFVIFSNFIDEDIYNIQGNYLGAFHRLENKLGIKLLNSNYEDIDTYEYIISTDVKLDYVDNELINTEGYKIHLTSASYYIYALRMSEGDIPHCINNEDRSFSFFGVITNSSAILYKGMIKLYYHVASSKFIIEIVTPQQVDNEIVTDYGPNILLSNPLIYKDYINFQQHDFYVDYMGNGSNSKNAIDILTVAMYDNPVLPAPYENESTANMIYGVELKDQNVYIRPYLAIPKGTYGVVVNAKNNNNSDVRYDFNSQRFVLFANSTRNLNKVTSITYPTEYTNPSIIPWGSHPLDKNNTRRWDLNEDLTVTKVSIPNIRLIAKSYVDTSNITPSVTDNEQSREYNIGINKVIKTAYINKYSIPTISGNIASTSYIYQPEANSITKSRYKIQLVSSSSYNYHKPVSVYPHQYYRNEYANTDPKILLINENNKYSMLITCNYTLQLHSYINIQDYTIDLSDFDHPDYLTFNTRYTSTVYEQNRAYTSNIVHTFNFDFDKVQHIYIDPAGTSTQEINGTTEYITTYNISYDILYTLVANDYSVLHTDLYNLSNGFSDYVGLGETADGTDYLELRVNGVPKYLETQYGFYISSSGPYKTSHTADVYFDNNSSIDFQPIVTDVSNTVADLGYAMTISTSSENDSTIVELNETISCNQDIHVISSATSNLELYNYNTDFSTLSREDIVNFLNSANPFTPISMEIGLTTTSNITTIASNFVHMVQDENNNRNFNIPVKETAFNNINTSSINVELFPILDYGEDADTSDDINYYVYKEETIVKKSMYSIRTDGYNKIDHTELSKTNKIRTTALRMCNHLGHTVVWGDDTGSSSLYYSAYCNPAYFPSNYVITLDNPIVLAYPHNGNLIIFTTDDIYMLYGGNVPSTTSQDGTEVPFTQKLIQANTRLGKDHINTVMSIGKDLFFINNNNKGYLLKTNKYVDNASDVYLVKLTSQIDDLLEDPYKFANERFNKWDTKLLDVSDQSDTDINMQVTPVMYSLNTSLYNNVLYYYNDDVSMQDAECRVIDGDTFEIDGIIYRLADIDTPEITNGKNERLGVLAKNVLIMLISTTSYWSVRSRLVIVDTGEITYGRHVAYVFIQGSNDGIHYAAYSINVNATMLQNGLAKIYNSMHDSNALTLLFIRSLRAHVYAKAAKLGLYNSCVYSDTEYSLAPRSPIDYLEYDGTTYWSVNSYQLYTYANNSYIYIIQPVKLTNGKATTLIYKYSIDSKVWCMYDILGYNLPTDTISTSNSLGFSILNINDNAHTVPSILEFTNDKFDISNIKYEIIDTNKYKLQKLDTSNKFTINAYFDSGNQSISLMNDKLFREIKLSLGSLPDSLLNMDYQIDFYVDGKLVIPNQRGKCNSHIHHVPVNTHYEGKQENLEGFQKVTFFAPARGRIPRVVFSLNCNSDINILEYALVYMQLNAK